MKKRHINTEASVVYIKTSITHYQQVNSQVRHTKIRVQTFDSGVSKQQVNNQVQHTTISVQTICSTFPVEDSF